MGCGASGRSRAGEAALPTLLPPGLLPGPQHSCGSALLQLLPELLNSLSLRRGLVREPLRAQNPHSSGIFQNCLRQEDSSPAKGSEEPGISALFLDQANPGDMAAGWLGPAFLMDGGAMSSDELTSQVRVSRLREETQLAGVQARY